MFIKREHVCMAHKMENVNENLFNIRRKLFVEMEGKCV